MAAVHYYGTFYASIDLPLPHPLLIRPLSKQPTPRFYNRGSNLDLGTCRHISHPDFQLRIMSDSNNGKSRLSSEDWANLPDPILTHIFSHLTVVDRCRSAGVCHHWKHCLEIPLLWRKFSCGFFLPSSGKLIKCVEKYGCHVRDLSIELNQSQRENRANAVAALDHLASLSEPRLTHLTISFRGENPLFYAGQEFTSALCRLFQAIGKSRECSLKYLNLKGLESNFTDEFVNSLGTNCKNLEYLNILNKVLICNIAPQSMVDLIKNCKKLKVLHLYHASLSNEVLNALAQPDRQPLIKLGVVCRRQEKYGEDLTAEAWSNLTARSPSLKVELGFDHTCPLHRVSEIMKPEIPVQELHLLTFCRIYPEVRLAASFYNDTLVKLVTYTRPSKELEDALLEVAQRCSLLHTLYVYCVVRKETVDKILEMCPVMKKAKTYILKSEIEPEPWTVGQEEGD
ncbi:F-box/lrr-repeat protein 8 [Plakobranchus ocellatus]|uniref:F-box/LRR-repeat protein 8 n=1 Tax=Plakobranchus ocellatus TaxID=259542 RepID=A0AAV4BXS0_9GAST|nr:F-box/lrr-repeat protein 8 [Plakobranchus ocellatus]